MLCYRTRSIVDEKQLHERNKTNNFVDKLNDVTDQLQRLMKRTIDDDTYNLDAFDQCEGAWPIGHPLPLPLWSHRIKAPLIVEKVSSQSILHFILSICSFWLE